MAEIIELQYPITVDGEEIAQVNLRRPTIRDMEKAAKHKDDLKKSIYMLVDLCEISPTAVRSLDTEDFNRLAKKVGEFTDELAD